MGEAAITYEIRLLGFLFDISKASFCIYNSKISLAKNALTSKVFKVSGVTSKYIAEHVAYFYIIWACKQVHRSL